MKKTETINTSHGGNCPAKIRIGTRASRLAVAQAQEVKNRLLGAFPELTQTQIEIIKIETTGDRIQDRHLAEIGGKGLFTKEIEEGLQSGAIDIAVHSMKDMPAEFPEGLIIPCILEREDARDAFLSHKVKNCMELPKGAVVGTSSVRRQSQLLSARPDLKVVQFRGNVITRLEKLKRGDVDATFLAVAGLKRIEMADAITSVVDPKTMIPAVAQGAIGVECLSKHGHLLKVLDKINHAPSFDRVTAERAFLQELGGSCTTPMGCLAEIQGNTMTIHAMVAAVDGSEIHRAVRSGKVSDAIAMGRDLGQELKKKGGHVLTWKR
ncbi:MAG: hydroxymethylbilane synthase [Proteobacteria bacterium]|nr:hydroxymethylbilane synthase [Pseudomonadota bacterium]